MLGYAVSSSAKPAFLAPLHIVLHGAYSLWVEQGLTYFNFITYHAAQFGKDKNHFVRRSSLQIIMSRIAFVLCRIGVLFEA